MDSAAIGASELFQVIEWQQDGLASRPFYTHDANVVRIALRQEDELPPIHETADAAMTAQLLQIVESTTLTADQIAERTNEIRAALLGKSKTLDQANFTRIHPVDLQLLFAEYDERFFDSQISRALQGVPLDFGFSNRMTSSGGRTAHYAGGSRGGHRYEITISTAILFGCFREDDHRTITASGIVCTNRLDALQRIMEHELTHLVEMLLWDASSCAKPRFHSITLRFFSHTENKHKLITPREKAIAKYGIQPGMTVRFRHEGVERRGVVNRINKRATVLVEDRQGQRYSNGKHYAKFYVPMQLLEPVK